MCYTNRLLGVVVEVTWRAVYDILRDGSEQSGWNRSNLCNCTGLNGSYEIGCAFKLGNLYTCSETKKLITEELWTS